MNLKDIKTEDLERELERRELRGNYPQTLDIIDWSEVIEQATSRRDSVIEGNYHEDNDDTQYMFEAVMEAVFGEEYFSWENELTN